MAKYANGAVASSVSSTARSTSPNWHSREELTAIHLRPVAREIRVNPPSSTTFRAAENFGFGKLSGPPESPPVGVEVSASGVATADSSCRGAVGFSWFSWRWWRGDRCAPGTTVVLAVMRCCGGADEWRFWLMFVFLQELGISPLLLWSCCRWCAERAIFFYFLVCVCALHRRIRGCEGRQQSVGV